MSSSQEQIVFIERAVLSNVLFDSTKIEGISKILKQDDIFLSVNKEIYIDMLYLYKKDLPIDENFLIQKSMTKNKKEYEKALLEILGTNPVENYIEYAKELKNSSQRRKINQNIVNQKKLLQENVSNEEIIDSNINFNKSLIEESEPILELQKISEAVGKLPEFFTKDWLPFPKNTVSIISAPGGTGKTYVALQLAIRYVLENPSKKAFLWLSEDTVSLCKARATQICKLLNQDEKILENITISESDPIHLLKNNRGNFEISSKLEHIKSELRDFDMIVFDPLLAFYGGDENHNSQARTFMQPFLNWCKKEKKCIIFIHHSSKSQTNENRSRGAGAFIDACRLLYEIDKVYVSTGDKRKLDDSKLHMRSVKLSKDNYGAIKYLKYFEVKRHITPIKSSQMTIQNDEKTTI